MESKDEGEYDPFDKYRVTQNHEPLKNFDNTHLATPEEVHKTAKKQRLKDRAWDRVDRPWYNYYEENEEPSDTGMPIEKKSNYEDSDDFSSYKNQYVYTKKPFALFYVFNKQVESVPIEDLERFQKELNALMNDEYTKYSRKHLTYQEIEQLITNNGGHKPLTKDDPLTLLHEKARVKYLKHQFFCKSRECTGKTRFELKDNPYETGVPLFIESQKDNLFNYEKCEKQYLYLYIEETCELFYFQGPEPEIVSIENLELFKIKLTKIMDTEDAQYSLKHLSYEEIEDLITSNGGHEPSVKQNQLKKG